MPFNAVLKILYYSLSSCLYWSDGLLDYYPFGMLVPNRHADTEEYRYGFQRQEKDKELKGEGNSLNFNFRMHDPRVGRFFATDPLESKYVWNSPYAFSENRVLDAVELEGKEAFFVHGTQSTYARWHSWDTGNKAPEPYSYLNVGAYQLFRMSGNKSLNSTFDWFQQNHIEEDLGINIGNGVFNGKSDRGNAAKNLIKYIMHNLKDGEDITLIGHSHGGNVSIQAIPGLRKALDKAGYKDKKINLITVETPVENDKDDVENPETYSKYINNHIHLYNTRDGIIEKGATIFGRHDFDVIYDNPSTKSIKIDVSSKYGFWNWMDSHSWDVQYGELLKAAIDKKEVPIIKP